MRRRFVRFEVLVQPARNSGNYDDLSLLLLGRDIVAVCLGDALETLVFFTVFLDETASHKVLKLFVSTETKHFFATTYSIPLLETCVDFFEKVIKSKELLVSAQYINEFIGNVVWKSAGKTSSFCCSHARTVAEN